MSCSSFAFLDSPGSLKSFLYSRSFSSWSINSFVHGIQLTKEILMRKQILKGASSPSALLSASSSAWENNSSQTVVYSNNIKLKQKLNHIWGFLHPVYWLRKPYINITYVLLYFDLFCYIFPSYIFLVQATLRCILPLQSGQGQQASGLKYLPETSSTAGFFTFFVSALSVWWHLWAPSQSKMHRITKESNHREIEVSEYFLNRFEDPKLRKRKGVVPKVKGFKAGPFTNSKFGSVQACHVTLPLL